MGFRFCGVTEAAMRQAAASRAPAMSMATGLPTCSSGPEETDGGAPPWGAADLMFGFADCNHNQLDDGCELEHGLEVDVNGNGLPDSCDQLCAGDVNLDGVIDPLDVGAVLSLSGQAITPLNLIYDTNSDGAIDPLDTGFVLSRFGACE